MSLTDPTEYNDAYPTCVETHSTLRIFSDELAPDEITEVLKIEPTKVFRKGDSHGRGRFKRKTNAWFYSTEKLSTSRDTRRHIDLILGALARKIHLLKKLHRKDCKIDIVSFYRSVGQGGPWLMPQQMLKLGKLGIHVWWDIYFADDLRK